MHVNDVNIVMLCMRNIDSAMTSNSLFRELSGSDEEGRENPIRRRPKFKVFSFWKRAWKRYFFDKFSYIF